MTRTVDVEYKRSSGVKVPRDNTGNQIGRETLSFNGIVNRSDLVSIATVAHRVEMALDSILPVDENPSPVIQSYLGYSTATDVVIRGRVLADIADSPVNPNSSVFANAWAMARNFATWEMAEIDVKCGEVTTTTGEEGYFRLELPRSHYRPGEQIISLPEYGAQVAADAVITSSVARFGIISDIDDTIMKTEAWALYRNVWNTVTGNARTRHVFADSARFISTLHDEINPVFYVSSSPWNLYRFLTDVFAHNDVVKGPMFLRDLGIDDSKFIKSSHGSHKGAAIDDILAANPDLEFVLIGDTGQHDAQVYHDAIKRHPGRIRFVALRHAGTVDADDDAALEALKRSSVACYQGASFEGADVPV